MLRRARAGYEQPFEMIDYTAAVEHRAGRGMFSEATVKVRVGDRIFHEVAEGNGPVNALNRALRKAIMPFYPRLRAVHLTDYKVRILDSDSGTAAMTRVLIDFSDGDRQWTTVGASHQHHRGKLDCPVGLGGVFYLDRRRAQPRGDHRAGTHRRRRLITVE